MKNLDIENEKGIQDLYDLSEKEIIYKIKHCGDKRIEEAFDKFQKTTKVYESEEEEKGRYCISVEGKGRYIIPLVKCEDKVKRINEISENAKNNIVNFLNYNQKKYAYVDFNF